MTEPTPPMYYDLFPERFKVKLFELVRRQVPRRLIRRYFLALGYAHDWVDSRINWAVSTHEHNAELQEAFADNLKEKVEPYV